jgi:type IV secretory pathway TrbF-like protein
MEQRVPLPRPAKDFNTAKRLYMEQFGSALVTNNYLKVALAGVSLVAVGLIVLNIRTYQTFENFKPLVIRISDIGRAEALSYDSFQYAPQDAEIRYFLIQFVTKHYSRRRATIREAYAESLYFLDGRLADAAIEANRKNKTIETFLAGEGDEIEVAVKNVSIDDLREPPYKATVDFEKVYYTQHDHIEIRRERYVAHFVFVVKEGVPNSMIPVNPLGLTITYFREDEAFQ